MPEQTSNVDDVALARELREEQVGSTPETPEGSTPETLDGELMSDNLIFDTIASRCP
jgi:hypothetical protein